MSGGSAQHPRRSSTPTASQPSRPSVPFHKQLGCPDGTDIIRASEGIVATLNIVKSIVDTHVQRLLHVGDPVRVLETMQALPKLRDASRGQDRLEDDMNTLGVATSVYLGPGVGAGIASANDIKPDDVQDHAQVHMTAINVEERRKRRRKRRKR
jgi:hypothetical protein